MILLESKNLNSRNDEKPLIHIVKGGFLMKPKFKRHFRIYLVNNHPAYIVDEEGKEYVFHRVSESKTSGGKKNWKINGANPLKDINVNAIL